MLETETLGKSASSPDNCWEFKKCGREPGGDKAVELGVCPATTSTQADGTNRGKNGGRICWAVAGTLCGGQVQGSFAQKQASCLICDLFAKVKREEGDRFLLLLPGQKYAPPKRGGPIVESLLEHGQPERVRGVPPGFDKTRLDRWRKVGGDKLVSDLIASFLENAPRRIETARAGMTALDASAIERAVHSLKSSCGNVGAVAMQDLCQQVETLASAREMGGIPSLLCALEQEFSAARTRLDLLGQASTAGQA